MESLFFDLHKLGVRITGSYACGKQTQASDIDIYLPFGKFKKLQRVLAKHSIEWDSFIIGEIHTTNLSPRLEFGQWFWKREDRKKTVDLYGFTFKTH